jgi:hypothetical protein
VVRLVPYTAAFWMMQAEFATIRERLIKIGVRVIEHIAPHTPALDEFPSGHRSELLRSVSCRPLC